MQNHRIFNEKYNYRLFYLRLRRVTSPIAPRARLEDSGIAFMVLKLMFALDVSSAAAKTSQPLVLYISFFSFIRLSVVTHPCVLLISGSSI